MRLRNVSPLGHLDVPSIGRQGDPIGKPGKGCLEPGEEFEVPDELAGRAPAWRPITDDDTDETLQHLTRRENDGVAEVFDLGSGLLASVGVFEPVAKTAAKKGSDS